MASEKVCAQCGNSYNENRTLKVDYGSSHYDFDCFECAISKLAPRCKSCQVTIIGHGVEKNTSLFCSERCSNQ